MTIQQKPNVRVWLQGREYVEAAEILWDYNRLQPAAIMAALALEILLKSFLATRLETGGAKTQKGHSLTTLFNDIDPQTQADLLRCSREIDESVDFTSRITEFDRIFPVMRYWYEPDARYLSVSSDIVYFARHAVETIFLLGKRRGV